MKRKRKGNPIRFAVMLGILFALLAARYAPSEPDTVILYPPKQLHHVIYIAMCGVLEGIVLTTDPVQFADPWHNMTPEMTELEEEALLAGRVFQFTAGLWVTCGEPFPENIDIIERDET